ncbi:unnamed protein product [Caenorhabditis bovis]|uniref:Peptidase M13 C-terminal domain-containing protein n=1 Tax=Caenorhabditis bovis TaxID=2654633 RepID=A0A8S1E7F0_9PELO|nr:unnamed protein product [Caenorhabditis bovis]
MGKGVSYFTALAIVIAVGISIASLVLNIIILNQVNKSYKNSTEPIITPNHTHYDPSQGCGYNVSQSPEFKAAADYLLNGLDPTVDPCQDFYAFTCNKFLQNTDLKKLHRSRLGTYDQAQVDVFTEVAASLAKIDINDDKISKTERITKAAYDSCHANLMNPPDRTQVVYREIKNLFGGAPFLGDQLRNNVDYWDVAGQLEQKHALGTLSYSIGSSDYKNHLQNALYIGEPELSLAREYYVKPQFIDQVNQRVKDVNDLLTSFAHAVGKQCSADDVLRAAQETVNFEVQIAMASWPDDLMRNYQQQYNAYNLDGLNKAYSGITWNTYIGSLFDGIASVDKQKNFNLVITQPSYFAWLNSVFSGSTVNSTVVANYMIAQLIADEADFINPATQKANSKYIHYALRAGRGVSKIGRHEVRVLDLDGIAQGCMNLLTAYMPYGTGYVYVKGKSERNDVKKDGMIDSLQWMDDYSKERAHNKSESLVKNFGWPDMFGNFIDFKDIDDYNSDYASIIDIYKNDSSNIYDIMAVLKKGMEVRELFRILNEPAKRENFLQSPAMVNAWYQPERNSITFPYAAWNPPYYHLNYPQAYNFAGQGGTGGHELTHGYDDEGVQFGFNGELTNCTWNKCGWMDSSSSSGFVDMAQCVVTQFSTKCCPEKTGNVHCANGATTQGENIADLGGQQAAYRAYREYVATVRNGQEEERLPGLEKYTPNQIFWITYGYSWCMKQTDENLVHQLLTNPHSPGSCRTNNVMQDIPEFGIDFGCVRGTPMYPPPSERCKVWVGN